MKKQIQKAGSDTNKQNICGGKLIFEHRELSESEATLPVQAAGSSQQAPFLQAQRGLLCPRTAQPLPGPWSQRRRCTLMLLLLLDILVTLQAPLH